MSLQLENVGGDDCVSMMFPKSSTRSSVKSAVSLKKSTGIPEGPGARLLERRMMAAVTSSASGSHAEPSERCVMEKVDGEETPGGGFM